MKTSNQLIPAKKMRGGVLLWTARAGSILAAALCLLAPPSSHGQLAPELVLKDTFDVSATSVDLNFENAERQTGSAAPVTYTDNAVGAPELTQLNHSSAPGALIIQADGIQNYVAVSPNHNFTEGGNFSIEFELDAGLEDPQGASGDWACIVFGASSQNVFVNASNGIGILFRNNGEIQVFDGNTLVYGGNGGIEGGLPKGKISVRIVVESGGFNNTPATISMFVNDTQVRVGGGEGLSHVKAAGFSANFITLGGSAFGGNFWTHAFDNLTVNAEPCIRVEQETVIGIAGQRSPGVTVTIPSQLNATADAVVTVRSDDPSVAIPTGADANGELALTFTAGGATTKTFTVTGVGAGNTAIRPVSAAACVVNFTQVHIAHGPGFAELLFLDTFDTSVGSTDVNFEIEQRQSGTVAPLTYLESAASAAGGPADDFTQVSGHLPGRLTLIEQNVSPNHNFIEGPEFTIEFGVEPGSIGTGAMDDWAAIVFGASAPNRFVISQDGMGILFRNDGRIEVWDGPRRIYGSSLEDAFPLGVVNVRIEAKAADFLGLSAATISMSINGTPQKLTADSLTYVKPSGFRGNFITLLGYGQGWIHSFDSLKVEAMAGVNFGARQLTVAPGDSTTQTTVKIPAALSASQAVTVQVVAMNPGIATLEGAVDGVLTLEFAQGGPIEKTINIQGVGKGTATFVLMTDTAVLIGPPLEVTRTTALVDNPSFEANPLPGGVGYGAIAQWQGGSGLNPGPFADNGVIPDRNQIAFVQGANTLSQLVEGLEPGKQYWLQFYYNTRNCCGERNLGLAVRFGEQELVTIDNIVAVGGSKGYHFVNVPFVPESSSGLLQFATTVTGDATLLLDAVTIVERADGQIVLRNPTFEASGVPPFPGYIQPASIAGWTGTGGYGVNFSGAGPFADNGLNTDQDLVAFIQGAASLSQTISGLVEGEQYTIRYAYNARSGNQPHLRVTLGDTVIQDVDVTPVGLTEPYHVHELTFTATSSSGVLTFAQTAEGDHTVLIDNVILEGKTSELPCITVGPSQFDLTIGQTSSDVTVTIPEQLNAQISANVTVRALNPDVAIPVGASANGELVLTFPAGGATTQTFAVQALQGGTAAVELSNTYGVCFDNPIVTVAISRSLVRNPSFEANSIAAFPGYGDIQSWRRVGDGGNAGINAGGPFGDNGQIPDRNQIAFIQNTATLQQPIGPLDPEKEYWLQFRYNVRNCCGGTMALTVRFAGEDLAFFDAIQPVGDTNPYYTAHIAFKPAAASGLLEFVTSSTGDASLLLDAVTLVQRDPGNIVVQNPSFEASGIVPFPGYIMPALISGWTTTPNYGVNVSGPGPFADNGHNPDQGNVLLLQSEGASAQQVVSGLTVGSRYTLSYAYNARNGNQPQLTVSLNGEVVQEESVTPVGGGNPYYVNNHTFTAVSDVAEIKFTQTAAGDNTVLIDNVRIFEGEGPVEVELDVRLTAEGNVRISWPSSAEGFELESATELTGNWTPVQDARVVEGNEFVVTVAPSGAKFYRLRKAQ